MTVNFAAVHDRKAWRKHRIHQSLHSGIDGKDGAKNLLRRIGRVADMWQKYGDVKCVFVWEDSSPTGHAFRLATNGSGEIDFARPLIDNILQLDFRKTCSSQEIAALFASDTPRPGVLVSVPAAPIQASVVKNGSLWPDDLPEDQNYFEGLAQGVLVNRYERSLAARAACIAQYGCVCQVCLVDFSKRYGALGDGFIHVHHVLPISAVGRTYRVDPVADLVPVCPNCHAMLHRQDPPLRIEDLRALLQDG